MVLGVAQLGRAEFLGRAHILAQLDDLLELVEEPPVDLGGVEQLLDGRAQVEGPPDLVEPAVGGGLDRFEQLFEGAVHRGAGPESGALGFERAQHLAEGLGEVAADGHRLSHRLHGRGEGAVAPGNFSNANRGALTTT